MENKNALNDTELLRVSGGYVKEDGLPFDAYRERVVLRSRTQEPISAAIVKDEDILKEIKLPDFNLDTLSETVKETGSKG